MPTDIIDNSWYEAVEVTVNRTYRDDSGLLPRPSGTLRLETYENVHVRFRPGWLDVALEGDPDFPVTAYPLTSVVLVSGVTKLHA